METILTWGVAVLGTVIGLGSFFHMRMMMSNWTEVGAVVTGNAGAANRTMAGGSTPVKSAAYLPVMEFTAQGQVYSVTGGSGQSAPFEIGAVRKIYYKPTDPNHFLDLDFKSRMLFSGGFFLMGLLCWLVIAGVIS